MTAPKTDESGIRLTIRALVAAGYKLDSVNNGGEDNEPVSTEKEAIEEATASDHAFLFVTDADGEESWVMFVLGNEPFEVICNHSGDLDHVLTPLTDGWDE